MSDIGAAGEALSPGAFIVQAVNEGLSMRQAVAGFREAGFEMGNQAFRQMFGEIREAVGNRDVIAGLDYGAIPPADAYSTWAAGDEGQYATFVTSYTRMPGTVEIEPRYYTYVTDEPHTPQEAVDAAAGFYTGDQGQPGYQQGVYQGSVITSMTRTRRRD